MKIRVRYFSLVSRVAQGLREEEFEMPAGSTLGDAIKEAATRHPALEPYLKSLLVTRNHQWSGRAVLLQDNDEIGIMPPVSGG